MAVNRLGKVLTAVAVYAVATGISVALWGGNPVGVAIDGALLLGLFYYLATLER